MSGKDRFRLAASRKTRPLKRRSALIYCEGALTRTGISTKGQRYAHFFQFQGVLEGGSSSPCLWNRPSSCSCTRAGETGVVPALINSQLTGKNPRARLNISGAKAVVLGLSF